MRFYRELAPALEGMVPGCHFAEIDPTGGYLVVLEDLAGYRCGDQVAGCGPRDAWEALRTLARFHEVDEDVHASGPDREARHLAAGHEGDPELGGPLPGGADAGQGVVVGQGHGAAPGLHGQLDHPARGVTPVGHGGVGVQVDHAARGYRGRGCAPWPGRSVPGPSH